MKYKKHAIWLVTGIGIAALVTSPAVALCLGTAASLVFGNRNREITGQFSKQFLQLAVILLGFGLQIGVILKVGFASLGITAVSITSTLLVGMLIGKWLKVDREIALLTSSGTAICGGSAIAAMGPSINASENAMGVSLAVVFLLNGIALFVFPPVGQLVGLTQNEFGLWSALAIHDTSSVVGAAATYGAGALAIGTTVKLTRALWIMPVSFIGTRLTNKRNARAKFPLFLLGFVLAAAIRSLFPDQDSWWLSLNHIGKQLMILALFFIGAGLTKESLKTIGGKVLVMAVALWMTVSVVSLALIKTGVCSIDLKL
ncbi:putative sulfate exporter family transporter [Planctomycetota bacterium]|nr:putative sulfate exporter family transporter [Planctomycetota bacterium]